MIWLLLSSQSAFNAFNNIETAKAAGVTYYLDGQSGSDINPGTMDLPWKTITHAVDNIVGGDTVILREGIYRQSLVRFGPAGLGPDQMTTFKAASGERVIFTSEVDLPPTIELCNEYLRIEGLWFGGRWKVSDAATILCLRRGNEFIDNTFFGYREISQGGSEYITYQGNRFVHSGWSKYPVSADNHPIYLSGGYTPGSMGQHSVVDNNILIAGEGHAIHGWHNWRSSVITRNFIAAHNWGLVIDGSDHLIANNFFWKETGLPSNNLAPYGPSLVGEKALFFNNIMGPNGGISPGTRANNSIYNNAFLGASPWGENPIILTPGNELNDLGISAEELDQTIAALDSAFSQPVADIFANTSIEPAFAKLKLTIPEISPLYQSGVDWLNHGSAINLGPDAPGPEDMDAFWFAFRSNNLCDWDKYGVKISCGLGGTWTYLPLVIN